MTQDEVALWGMLKTLKRLRLCTSRHMLDIFEKCIWKVKEPHDGL